MNDLPLIDWPLALILFLAGVALAFVMGRGWIPKAYRPLAAFLLVVLAIGIMVSLNESWQRHREQRQEVQQVVAALREMRAEAADYRRALARAIPMEADGAVTAERGALNADQRQVLHSLTARLQHHPLLLKHASSVSYNQLASLLEQMSVVQEQLATGNDEAFIQRIMLLQSEIELLDKILAWESAYQLEIFSLVQLTGFMEQLERSRPTPP